MRSLAPICLLLVLAGCSKEAESAPIPAPSNTWSEETIRLLETLPVQDGGRVKPLSTYARYKLLGMNAKSKVKTKEGNKLSATEWLLDVLFAPDAAMQYPVFYVRTDEVIDALEVGHVGRKKADRYSYAEIAPGRKKLIELARKYDDLDPQTRGSVEQQILDLAHNFFTLEGLMSSVRGIATGQVPGRDFAIFPPPGSPSDEETWMTPVEVRNAILGDPAGLDEQGAILALLGEVVRHPTDAGIADPKMKEVHDRVVGLATARGEYGRIEMEVSFYHAAWFHWGLGFFAIGLVLVVVNWLLPRFWPVYWGAILAVLVAVVATSMGITLRCVIRGRPPVNTLYETILFITATAALIALVTELMNRKRIALSVAAFLGLGGLLFAMRYEVTEGRDTFTPLVAVLRTNFWLATHVTTVTLGYSAGLLAAMVANIYVIGKLVAPRADERFFRMLGRMVYGTICFGLFFSVIGTILGGIWANDSWGRFWGWDPKENGALLIVLWELAMLHARRGGYIRDLGFAMAAIFGGMIVVFSWWHVNQLGVGLHSYGFTSGILGKIFAYYGFQSLVLVLGGVAFLLHRAGSTGENPPAVSGD